MPVATVGRTETRTLPEYRALHRSDNGACLSIAGANWKPVQNDQMLEQFIEIAKTGNLEITHVGCLDGGKRVVAIAKSPYTRSVEYLNSIKGDGTYNSQIDARAAAGFRKDDVLSLQFIISNSHVPGISMKIRARVVRLACLNGVTTCQEFAFKLNHRNQYDSTIAARIRAFIERVIGNFDLFMADTNAIAQTRATRPVQETFIAELIQPELIRKAAERLVLPSRFATASMEELGRVVLDEVMSYQERILEPADYSRLTNAIINDMDTQPGGDLSAGTLYHALNGVTHYVDHIQGRGAETGVASSLWGNGDQLKQRAQALAVQYAQRLARA